MTGSEFLRKIEKLARRTKIEVSFIPERGKGSHGTLWYGGCRTTIPDRKKELKKGTLNAMVKQLGLALRDLDQE